MGILDAFRKKRPPEVKPDARAVFLAEVEAVARRGEGVTAVSALEADFSLRVMREGKEHKFFLDNLFAETRGSSPEERQTRIGGFLTALSRPEVDLTWDEARPRLRCALRGPLNVSPQFESESLLLSREVLPCLRELVAIDSEASLSFVNRKDLERWGAGEEQVFRRAEANLAEHAMEGVEVYTERPDRIWSVEADDTYEASRLVIPGFLSSFRDKVNGRPVAIVPERSSLYISGDARPETVAWLCEKARREYEASPRRVSCALYTVDDAGQVISYVREGSDETALHVYEATVTFKGAEYAAQKELLDEHHKKSGIDLFVASFTGFRLDDGSLASYCTWTQGITSLLPQTDVVIFRTERDGFFTVEWADVLRIAAHALKAEPEYFPQRWRTLRDLREEEVRALLAAQV